MVQQLNEALNVVARILLTNILLDRKKSGNGQTD